MRFSGKSALVTGAASGMGLLCAQCLAAEGARVTLTDWNEAALAAAVEDIRAAGGDAVGCAADVRDYAQVEQVCDEALRAYSAIDILICCAGGAETRLLQRSGTFDELPIEVFDYGIDLNLKGAVYFDHAVMRRMARQGTGGVLINMGSITGEEGCASNLAYSASKSALMNGVVKSLARAGARHGIRAVCIAPGPVLTRPGMAGMKTLEGRAAQPQELVDMILYAASEQGAFLNGTAILMDGGRSAMGHG